MKEIHAYQNEDGTSHPLSNDTSAIWMIPSRNLPIKLISEGRCSIIESDGYNVTISYRLTTEEVADLFGVDVLDVLDGKIGFYILDKEKEN